MSTRALGILLGLSVLLNVSLLGGAAFGLFAAERDRPDPEAHVAAVAERLDLTEGQTAALRAFRQRTLEGLAAQREGGGEVRERLVGMLDDPVYDTAEVKRTLDARAAARNAFWAEVGQDLHAWVSDLPESKQEDFVEMARDRDFFRKLFARQREE
jgi:uncharacterized membrane protein